MKKLLILKIALLCIFHTNGQINGGPLKGDRVIFYDSTKAERGVTIVDAGTDCFFVTMDGKMQDLHLQLVDALPDGNFLGYSGSVLVKFDEDLNVIWTRNIPLVDHDLTTDDQGNIYVLSTDFHEMAGATVKFDVIKIYNPEGLLIYKWCLFDHLDEFIPVIEKSEWLKGLAVPYSACKNAMEYILQYPDRFFSPIVFPVNNMQSLPFCLMEFSHFNSIQVIPENEVSKKIPAFKKGNLLLSFNPYSCYGILNPATGKIEWAGYLSDRTTLHTPLLTPTGSILVFENSTFEDLWNERRLPNDFPGCSPASLPTQNTKQHSVPVARTWTSATEYDPVTNTKIWEYVPSPADSIRADYMGSTQRLPNGNTLMCSFTPQHGGKIFEITPQKEIVWNYVYTTGGLYRAKRINLKSIAKY